MTRPSWPEHWMRNAHNATEMSTCASGRKVGAVAVIDNRQVVTGVNGVPAGYPHPLVCRRRMEGIPSGVAAHLCGCQHAEANVIANAARHGACLRGTTIYVTCQPCSTCMGQLANAGVAKIVYEGDYPDPEALRIAEFAGIEVVRFD